ncbi:hypothetical protein [Massilia sp. METH4]|uniref:hypothetical protein n=1 Tax=Massilia sp. METH4 TaxID=3123041 RepID=UPI0030CE03E0
MEEQIETFLARSERVFLLVRERKVPEPAEVDGFLRELDKLAKLYEGSATLPKKLVEVMLDMSTALYSSADAHPEPARTRLYHISDAVTDKMRDICTQR